MNDEEKFFAWLDGELAGAEAAAMEARVASDPELARLAEQHRAMQSRLKGAFDTVAETPVPKRLLPQAGGDQSNVVDLSARRERPRAPRFAALPQWALVAATLVLGIFVGTTLPGDSKSPVEVRSGTLYAAGELGQALDTRLASAPAGGDVRIGVTFRDSAGSVCRTFSGGAASGLACNDDGRWRLRGLFPAPEGQQGDYRMATGMNPGLAALLDSTMAGEPMNAAEEAAAAKRGWK